MEQLQCHHPILLEGTKGGDNVE